MANKWAELNHQEKLILDFESLKTRNPSDSNNRAVDFILDGYLDSTAFIATISTKLILSQPYDIYKNAIVNTVSVSGVEGNL